jgi:hypothetical protein
MMVIIMSETLLINYDIIPVRIKKQYINLDIKIINVN